MTSSDEQRVRAVVEAALQAVLKLKPDESAHAIRAEIPTWDSLAHVEILFAIEEEIGIQYSEQIMAGLASTDQLVAEAQRALPQGQVGPE
jgi:acyl carrier protein